MKKILLIFLSLGFSIFAKSQDVDILVDEVCRTLPKFDVAKTDSSDFYTNQLNISNKIFEKHFQKSFKETDFQKVESLNFVNVYENKFNRETAKKCPEKIFAKGISFLPSTNVVDFDRVFSISQYDKLKRKIIKIRKEKGLAILLVEIDDIFPFNNLEEFTQQILKNNMPYFDLERGKMAIVFSKSLRKIRISTDYTALQFIDDEFLQNNIDDVILPKFKQDNFYQGIADALENIDKKL